MVLTLVLASFAGCAGKNGGDTNVGDLDESAVYDSAIADNGFRVTGSLGGPATALMGGADGSATSVKVKDLSPDDAAGALDLADFLVDAKEADGSRLQAELRSMTTANDSGFPGDFFGGVLHNQEINGDSGLGYPDLPKVKAYILLQGLARVKQNDQTLEDLQLVQVAVTKGARDPSQALLATAENDLEVHVLFPGSLIPGGDAFPGSADGFVYYYFENVKLTQLTEEEKGLVGNRLQPPARPNVPPIATAVVRVDGVQVSSAAFDPDDKFLNVTLDASNSTDPDGRIEAYSWDVKEFNATGALVDVNKTSGAIANFSFTTGGTKVINLRIIDQVGGIANTTLFFFVNTVKTYSFAFGAGQGLDSAGSGTSCQPALNCHEHSATIFYGARQLTTTAIASSTTGCNTPHQDLKGPNGAAIASGNPLNVAGDKLTQVGKYELEIWFNSQVRCSYSFVLTVNYAPDAGATE
jgi:hypothetical protein